MQTWSNTGNFQLLLRKDNFYIKINRIPFRIVSQYATNLQLKCCHGDLQARVTAKCTRYSWRSNRSRWNIRFRKRFKSTMQPYKTVQNDWEQEALGWVQWIALFHSLRLIVWSNFSQQGTPPDPKYVEDLENAEYQSIPKRFAVYWECQATVWNTFRIKLRFQHIGMNHLPILAAGKLRCRKFQPASSNASYITAVKAKVWQQEFH